MDKSVKSLRYDIIAICLLLAAAVFLVDIYVPPRFSVAALYSLVIVISLTSGNPRTIRLFAWLCTALLLAGIFLSPQPVLRSGWCCSTAGFFCW